jgi:hypothetical protein
MTGRYPAASTTSYSGLSLAAFVVALIALVIGATSIGVSSSTRSDISELSRQLRTAQTELAAVELEQRQLNDRIGDATEAAAIAKAILAIDESR